MPGEFRGNRPPDTFGLWGADNVRRRHQNESRNNPGYAGPKHQQPQT